MPRRRGSAGRSRPGMRSMRSCSCRRIDDSSISISRSESNRSARAGRVSSSTPRQGRWISQLVQALDHGHGDSARFHHRHRAGLPRGPGGLAIAQDVWHVEQERRGISRLGGAVARGGVGPGLRSARRRGRGTAASALDLPAHDVEPALGDPAYERHVALGRGQLGADTTEPVHGFGPDVGQELGGEEALQIGVHRPQGSAGGRTSGVWRGARRSLRVGRRVVS